MSEIVNVYCDESCHLEKDQSKVMVIGAVWCLKKNVSKHAKHLREIKKRYSFQSNFEVKWVKVSKSRESFYLDWLDYFFDNSDLCFRGLVISDKPKLNHALYNQTHDDWYYKMHFEMLKIIIDPDFKYHIYLDIKDTLGARKAAKLQDVLANAHYDFSKSIIEKIQLAHSHEIELLQLSDLLIGAVCYANRHLSGNEGKEALVTRMRERSRFSLLQSTLPKERKVNLFQWSSSNRENMQ